MRYRENEVNALEILANPYTYKNFEVTEEPAEDPDPNAADTMAGFELKTPIRSLIISPTIF